MSHRVERFSSTLKHCLADILMNEINNPSLKNLIISDVITTPDLKKTKIFVASSVEDVKTLLPQLTKAKGYIKRLLAKRMYLKYIPDLIFMEDEVIASSLQMEPPMENQENDDSPYSPTPPADLKKNASDYTNEDEDDDENDDENDEKNNNRDDNRIEQKNVAGNK